MNINKIYQVLNDGGLVISPTDTVYGVCARINSIEAYNKLMQLKNRPITKLLPIMCADEEQIKSIAIVDKKVEKLIRAFMPGPITLILKKKVEVKDKYVTFNTNKITVRIRPIKNTQRTGLFNFVSSGTIPLVITLAPSSATAAPVNPTKSILRNPM